MTCRPKKNQFSARSFLKSPDKVQIIPCNVASPSLASLGRLDRVDGGERRTRKKNVMKGCGHPLTRTAKNARKDVVGDRASEGHAYDLPPEKINSPPSPRSFVRSFRQLRQPTLVCRTDGRERAGERERVSECTPADGHRSEMGRCIFRHSLTLDSLSATLLSSRAGDLHLSSSF